jgi:hypothetical protein
MSNGCLPTSFIPFIVISCIHFLDGRNLSGLNKQMLSCSFLCIISHYSELKKYISPGSDQILAELIQAGGKILLSVIHKLINSVWNKEELPEQ